MTPVAIDPDRARRADPSPRRIAPALALALLVTAGVFTLWEVAERTWFGEIPGGARHRLHLVRGISSSLLVAGLVGWFILRSAPGFLNMPDSRAGLAPPPTPPAERLALYARWFIAMRWLALLLSALLAFTSVHWFEWPSR